MKQCKACPWKKSTRPKKDIPGGYCEKKHAALKSTIAKPGEIRISEAVRCMACHESPVGAERPCVGWLAHQLGPGNNIALRFLARDGRYGELELVGDQHTRFEDTLKKGEEHGDEIDGKNSRSRVRTSR